MTTHTHVPADVDADSIIDLVEDCREIIGVLTFTLPSPRAADVDADSRGAMPVDISNAAVLSLVGYDDYGS